MKGIVLAGGAGSRLYPLTQVMTKQLQAVYDKPMIYYPLSMLMLGGIRDILLICAPADLPHFKSLLGDGKRFGVKLAYEVQAKPNGLPEAFKIGEKFIGDDHVTLILGDNLFYGDIAFYRNALKEHEGKGSGACVFAYSVTDPERYGVVEFDRATRTVKSIEEKPTKPKSSFAIPGLYLFDRSVVRRSKALKPSVRGETEIVDLILHYHRDSALRVEPISRGVAWLDTGTAKSLMEASSFISAIEERQGLKIACLEEIAYRMGFIDREGLQDLIKELPKCPYRVYLERIWEEG